MSALRSFLKWVPASDFEAQRLMSPKQVKLDMKKKGWSYRSAAPRVGRSYQWISDVLNGNATSQPVLRALHQLPIRTPLSK